MTFEWYRLQPVVLFYIRPCVPFRLSSDNERARLRDINCELSIDIRFCSPNRGLEQRKIEAARITEGQFVTAFGMCYGPTEIERLA